MKSVVWEGNCNTLMLLLWLLFLCMEPQKRQIVEVIFLHPIATYVNSDRQQFRLASYGQKTQIVFIVTEIWSMNHNQKKWWFFAITGFTLAAQTWHTIMLMRHFYQPNMFFSHSEIKVLFLLIALFCNTFYLYQIIASSCYFLMWHLAILLFWIWWLD